MASPSEVMPEANEFRALLLGRYSERGAQHHVRSLDHVIAWPEGESRDDGHDQPPCHVVFTEPEDMPQISIDSTLELALNHSSFTRDAACLPVSGIFGPSGEVRSWLLALIVQHLLERDVEEGTHESSWWLIDRHRSYTVLCR